LEEYRKRWTAAETSLLRRYWSEGKKSEFMSVRLNKSHSAIYKKAQNLGLPHRFRGRPLKQRGLISVPNWVPPIYEVSYISIAEVEGEEEAASFAREHLRQDNPNEIQKIMKRMGLK
jgi:hypothetical protein